MGVYYNDNDPFMADWLRRLSDADEIARGAVDSRSILDVQPADLDGYDQHHFFAGVGGWPAAFRLAGWADDWPVWSGSVPCQPLSSIGEHRAHADQRHLWPAFFRLIRERAPAVVFGEQVATPDGREWFAGIRTDLERVGYAVGAAGLPAAGAGSPTKRERIFFVGDTDRARLERQRRHGNRGDQSGRLDALAHRPAATPGAAGAWQPFQVVGLSDGTTRRVGPGIFPLADGVPARVGRLRGYGAAVVPQVAAHFIRAWLEVAP